MMERRSIKKKPSKAHIVWTPDPDRDLKRFDERHMRKWCNYLGADFEKYSRVDHDRGEDSRTQYQCVFTYQKDGRKAVNVGGKQLTMKTSEIPDTFIELDEEGVMRIQGKSKAQILDVQEFWHKGRVIFVRAKNRDKGLKLDVGDLAR